MSTAFLILASLLPGDGPPRLPLDQGEAALAELLSGSWRGTWTREGQTDPGVILRKGVFTMPMNPPWEMRLTITAEGKGWFRGTIGKEPGLPIVGIWTYERGRLMICSNAAHLGFPRRFEDGEKRDLETLWEK